MQKANIKFFAMLIVTVLLLTSCGSNGKYNNEGKNEEKSDEIRVDILNKSNEKDIAIYRLEQLIEAISNQDKETIVEMFSEQAQSENADIDKGIEYLFSIFKGEFDSWELIGGSVDESEDKGQKTVQYRYRFNVSTDTEKYLFSILEYTRDDNNPKNIGVFCLKIINVKDVEPKFTEAGIYVPDSN